MPWMAGGTPVTIENVVRIGKTRDYAIGMERATARQHFSNKRCNTCVDCFMQVSLFAAIDADHHRGLNRPVILAAIDGNWIMGCVQASLR
jgi:hypothetical protein